MIGLVDPYILLENSPSSSSLSVEWYEWPDVTYNNMLTFFINTTSYICSARMRNRCPVAQLDVPIINRASSYATG